MLRRRAERVCNVSCSSERRDGDKGAGGGDGGAALYVIDPALWRGVARLCIRSVVMA